MILFNFLYAISSPKLPISNHLQLSYHYPITNHPEMDLEEFIPVPSIENVLKEYTVLLNPDISIVEPSTHSTQASMLI